MRQCCIHLVCSFSPSITHRLNHITLLDWALLAASSLLPYVRFQCKFTVPHPCFLQFELGSLQTSRGVMQQW